MVEVLDSIHIGDSMMMEEELLHTYYSSTAAAAVVLTFVVPSVAIVVPPVAVPTFVAVVSVVPSVVVVIVAVVLIAAVPSDNKSVVALLREQVLAALIDVLLPSDQPALTDSAGSILGRRVEQHSRALTPLLPQVKVPMSEDRLHLSLASPAKQAVVVVVAEVEAVQQPEVVVVVAAAVQVVPVLLPLELAPPVVAVEEPLVPLLEAQTHLYCNDSCNCMVAQEDILKCIQVSLSVEKRRFQPELFLHPEIFPDSDGLKPRPDQCHAL